MTPLPRDRTIFLPPVGHDIGGHAQRFRDGLVASERRDEFGFHTSLSQIVSGDASTNCHRLSVEGVFSPAHGRGMENQGKNGGPNHLRAWRAYRGMTQAELAAAIKTNSNVIQYLETGERGLSAKWLRKLAPALGTTPGMLLDHDPAQLDSDLMDIWGHADDREKRQISELARAITRTGTAN